MIHKSYGEFKAEMAGIQQQLLKAKKSERANKLKEEVKRLCEEFGFTAGMLKGELTEGRKKSDS